MFESIKIYLNENIDIEKLSINLVEYGYHFSKRVSEEGDFSRLGDTVMIYPLTFEYPLRIELSQNKVEHIRSIDLLTYETIQDHNVAIILPIKGITKRRIRQQEMELSEESPIDNFVDIEVGDYVVHVDHGIGRYLGVEKVKLDKKYIDHFVIEYADGDRLYAPFTDLNKLQKYLGFEKRPPKLYKLGTKLWKRVKENAKKAPISLLKNGRSRDL